MLDKTNIFLEDTEGEIIDIDLIPTSDVLDSVSYEDDFSNLLGSGIELPSNTPSLDFSNLDLLDTGEDDKNFSKVRDRLAQIEIKSPENKSILASSKFKSNKEIKTKIKTFILQGPKRYNQIKTMLPKDQLKELNLHDSYAESLPEILDIVYQELALKGKNERESGQVKVKLDNLRLGINKTLDTVELLDNIQVINLINLDIHSNGLSYDCNCGQRISMSSDMVGILDGTLLTDRVVFPNLASCTCGTHHVISANLIDKLQNLYKTSTTEHCSVDNIDGLIISSIAPEFYNKYDSLDFKSLVLDEEAIKSIENECKKFHRATTYIFNKNKFNFGNEFSKFDKLVATLSTVPQNSIFNYSMAISREILELLDYKSFIESVNRIENRLMELEVREFNLKCVKDYLIDADKENLVVEEYIYSSLFSILDYIDKEKFTMELAEIIIYINKDIQLIEKELLSLKENRLDIIKGFCNKLDGELFDIDLNKNYYKLELSPEKYKLYKEIHADVVPSLKQVTEKYVLIYSLYKFNINDVNWTQSYGNIGKSFKYVDKNKFMSQHFTEMFKEFREVTLGEYLNCISILRGLVSEETSTDTSSHISFLCDTLGGIIPNITYLMEHPVEEWFVKYCNECVTSYKKSRSNYLKKMFYTRVINSLLANDLTEEIMESFRSLANIISSVVKHDFSYIYNEKTYNEDRVSYWLNNVIKFSSEIREVRMISESKSDLALLELEGVPGYTDVYEVPLFDKIEDTYPLIEILDFTRDEYLGFILQDLKDVIASRLDKNFDAVRCLYYEMKETSNEMANLIFKEVESNGTFSK